MSEKDPLLNPAAAAPVRLLIAEDDSNDLELCLRHLRRSGLHFQATSVSSREEFAQKLRDAPVDVVLSDYSMKGWTGMDALAMIRESCPGVPLILMSGTLGDERAVECIKLGVTDYVLKDQLARLPAAIVRTREETELRAVEMQAFAALRESEARYRSLVNNATYGICWLASGGELLYANPALVHMLGYDSAEELMEVSNSTAFYCDPEAREQVSVGYRKNGRIDVTVEWRCKGGKIISVRLNGRRFSGSERGDECIEMLVEDVTDRKELERRLVQAQKFEAIGQLAGGIAHDFNNMIGAIMGWADLGLDEAAPDSRIRRHFEKVRQQATRAASLTRQLLAFARRQILEPRSMDLNQTVVEALSLLEKVIGSNIQIKASTAPDLAVVHADPTQVEQVLMNLCINARDAMPSGGSLIVETANVTLDEEFCALQPLARPGHYAMLSVTDTGTGMDEATLDRIFEPFFTTKELGKGTGLGLATVYGIVRQHGGFVHVYSEPGIGSTFRAYFPTSKETVAAREPVEDSSPVVGGSETILVAEDHDGLRQIALETLTRLGYRVLLATDGEQAVQEFAAHRSEIALLLLDVVLPHLSGPEVYARLHAENPGLPVIFTTGYSPDIGLLEQAQRDGLPVLQKPYAPRNLALRVREALDRATRLASHDSD